MTDLEMLMECAKKLKIEIHVWHDMAFLDLHQYKDENGPLFERYDPLHDDAQAMALVKRFHLVLGRTIAVNYEGWIVEVEGHLNTNPKPELDLNRAIVECVARMK